MTSLSAIIEGSHITEAVQRLDIGGDEIAKLLGKFVSECTSNPAVTSSNPRRNDIFMDVKEQLANASETPESCDKIIYTLPDGSTIKIGNERFCCTEALFDPELIGMELPGIHTV